LVWICWVFHNSPKTISYWNTIRINFCNFRL